MSDLAFVIILFASNSVLCDSSSFGKNPICKQDCRLSKMLAGATVLPCNFEEVNMSYCREVSNSEQQTTDLVQECWNTKISEIMISWQHESGSLTEYFIHVKKNELNQGDIVMTKFCYRLYTSDSIEGLWSWAFTMTTHCLSLHLSYTMVNVYLLPKNNEFELWDEFIYEADSMCPTQSICNPWASDVRIVHHGISGAISVNVTRNNKVKEVFVFLNEIIYNKTTNKQKEEMKCEDASCSAWLTCIPTGIYRLEVIPTCDEICEDLGGCLRLNKEFAFYSTSEDSACSSLHSPVSTRVQTSQQVYPTNTAPVTSVIWIGAVVVATAVFLAVIVAVVSFLFIRWRRNAHIRQDVPELEEEAVLRDSLIAQENNQIMSHI